MKFIDINCMIGEWGYKKLHFKSADELSKEMERLKITRSFVFDSRSWLYDPRSGNDLIVEETKDYKNTVPVMVLTSLIDHEFGGRKNIYEYIEKNDIGAVRLFPIDHNYTLNLWNIDKLFSLADEVSIPVLLDCREDEGAFEHQFSQIFDIAKTYQKTPIILLTVGYRSLRIFYDLFEKCPNIYIDTSTFITFRGIEDVVRHFGSERIVFGTRMPFIEGGVSIGRLIFAEIEQRDKENIAYGNIQRMMQEHKLFKKNADWGNEL